MLEAHLTFDSEIGDGEGDKLWTRATVMWRGNKGKTFFGSDFQLNLLFFLLCQSSHPSVFVFCFLERGQVFAVLFLQQDLHLRNDKVLRISARSPLSSCHIVLFLHDSGVHPALQPHALLWGSAGQLLMLISNNWHALTLYKDNGTHPHENTSARK